MPKLLTDARRVCPELTDVVKDFESLSQRFGYDTVFSDFIDWLVWQHLYPPNDENPLKEYKKQEQETFLSMYQGIQKEVKKQVKLWIGEPENETTNLWYDPLGRMYECITSRHKSSALGQFFTPETVVNFMTQILDIGTRDKVEKVFDPTCGSGRFGLAAATYAISKKVPVWTSMNDIDPICTKMTAVNMAIHGIVGEVTCMDGLDIEGSTFRFGYKVVPALSLYPQKQWELIQMAILMKTGMNVRKQYVLCPISYEQTFLKGVNDQLLKDFEKRKQIADETEKQEALEAFQKTMKTRLKGTLFEHTSTEDLKLPSQKRNLKKKSPPPSNNGKDEQGTLF